ncbi:hypothetical protein SAMD00079811_67260 [Scytonema sp. HK-05]|nr:hypothetical protein SAMD00079811_67260 [Scytonema sp. HK-05]
MRRYLYELMKFSHEAVKIIFGRNLTFVSQMHPSHWVVILHKLVHFTTIWLLNADWTPSR